MLLVFITDLSMKDNLKAVSKVPNYIVVFEMPASATKFILNKNTVVYFTLNLVVAFYKNSLTITLFYSVLTQLKDELK